MKIAVNLYIKWEKIKETVVLVFSGADFFSNCLRFRISLRLEEIIDLSRDHDSSSMQMSHN